MGINWDLPLRFRRITDNNAQIILTLGTGAVEVFSHGWRDSPSHPLGCQEKILEARRWVTGAGLGRGEAYRRRRGQSLFLGEVGSEALGT